MNYEREPALEMIFNRHGKKPIPAVISAVLFATNGMSTEHFMRGCQALQETAELPENVGSAIRRLGRENSQEDQPHCCPKCLQYVDGAPMLGADGNPQTFAPSRRHYRKSTGSTYDRIGHITRCTCTASEKYAWMDEPKDGDRHPSFQRGGANDFPRADFKRAAGGDA